MSRAPGVQAVVRSASRRRLLVLVLEQAALPCGAALACAAVLLVLGTDILSWFWPALLVGAAAVYAAVRIRRRMLSPYRVAQLLDCRLGLNDSLATAWFLLSRHSAAHKTAAAFQIEQAERAAASIRPAAALPFTGRRMWALSVCLFAVTFGLFTVRYFKIDTLSLRQPLVRVHTAALSDFEKLLPAHMKIVPSAQRFLQRGKSGHTADAGQQPPDSGAAGSSAASSAGAQPGKAGNANANRRASASGANADAGNTHAASSTSLLRRMKDAIASLTADLRAHVAGKRSSPGNRQAGAAQSLAESKPSNGRKVNKQRGANNRQQALRKQGASLRSSQTSARRGSEPRSGIGSRNGEKDLKRAEDLAAMGKLAQIIGKRSADLTGDMTVQSAPGTAALRTPDTGRLGRHEGVGSEIRRDEIPPMYRDYVERYMEEVRKNAQ